MFTSIEQVGGMDLKLVYYEGLQDFSKVRHAQRLNTKQHDAQTRWAGGSVKDLFRGCERGDVSYAEKADKFVDEFANVAIQDYEVTLEWNDQNGELDYDLAMAGEEQYMYGPTVEKTDRSPVNLYVDQWTSCMIPTDQMVRRGVAILALAQSLSIYRPVNTYIATGTHHRPTHTDIVQVTRVPTNPMDISRASWMLASPAFFRQGQLPLTFYHSHSDRNCGVPPLSNSKWQATQLGKWLAERDGVQECLHLPLMYHSDDVWKSDKKTLEWVQYNLKRFMD